MGRAIPLMKTIRLTYLKKIFIICLAMFLTAIGIVMMRQADIGLDPWNVLSQGIERTTGISFGISTNIASFVVMVISLLLGEGIGLGTLGNVFVLGYCIDFVMWTDLIPLMKSPVSGIVLLIIGMEFAAFGTYLYMQTSLGEGPRDSLMVALAKHTPIPIGVCRITADALVTLAGWLLGGSVGIGTIITAFGIGSLIHLNLKLFKYNATGIKQENLKDSLKNFLGKD